MSFLNPLFFIGSLVLAVPILVHLVKKDKSEIVQFSSLMFLLRIPKKAIRHQKLRNLLLMAMRLLLIALLIGAFSRPYLIRSDDVQHDSRYQRGKVGVNDGCCSPFKSVGDGHSKNAAATYFLADSFKDQYVCVHGHTNSEYQACKPW